jgi:hypothetical protein
MYKYRYRELRQPGLCSGPQQRRHEWHLWPLSVQNTRVHVSVTSTNRALAIEHRRIPAGLWNDGGESTISRIWGCYMYLVALWTPLWFLLLRDCFLCGSSQWLSIPPHEYISHQKPKRHIRARTFQDCETTNIVNLQVRNNTRAVVVEYPNTEQYKNPYS